MLAAALLCLSACGGGGDDAAPVTGAASSSVTKDQAAADTAVTWTTIAREGDQYTLASAQLVRYGTGEAWVSQNVSGTAQCSNGAFGNDPAYGIVKVCQTASGGDTAWSRIAGEGQGFAVEGTQTVRYGAGTAWVTKTVAQGGQCSNEFFGNDPLYGVVKACEVSTAVASPPPSPAPAPPPVTVAVCTPPITAVDTSATAATVGNGSPASCTESALRAAVAANAVVRFDCGAAPTTIAIADTIAVPADRDTVIDGENRVTLDGGGRSRVLSLFNANYRTNTRGLTLQRIALRNGKAPGGGYIAPDPGNPSCAYGYASGSGAAIEVRDARLWVIDVDFSGNAAASPGPDVGGGAVYAAGSLDVTVAGSRFDGNSGANAGALGSLQTNLRVYNSSFTGNRASGVGRNYANADSASCPGVGHPGQGGAGGNGGAITIDGSDDTDVIVCGSTFAGNTANEAAGALFRTANYSPRRTTIHASTFRDNTARQGGALFIMNSVPLDITSSTFSGNSAAAFGAMQLQGSQFLVVNSTFSGNAVTGGVGGVLFSNGSPSSSMILNSTFVDNRVNGGIGFFSAALFGDTNYSVNNTVFSNNTTADPWNPMQCSFSPFPGDADVQWPPTRAVGGAGDTPCVNGIAFVDPLLGGLTANGGPTATRVPAAASPLRNAGRNCPPTDQRGNARSRDVCTIGAVE